MIEREEESIVNVLLMIKLLNLTFTVYAPLGYTWNVLIFHFCLYSLPILLHELVISCQLDVQREDVSVL